MRSGDWGGWDTTHQFVFSEMGEVLLTFQRFKEFLTLFPFKILDNVSSIHRGAVMAASSHWRRFFESDQIFKLVRIF